MANDKSVFDSPTKVTIADIARESGVSMASVSLALRNKPGVGDETRQQILQTAQAMGYAVDSTKSANAKSINSVGLIIKTRPNDGPFTNYFYAPVLAGIEAYCRQQQVNLFYAHLPVDENNNPLEPPRLLKEQSTDGLLFVGAFLNQATMQILLRQDVPVVLVDAYAVADQYDAVISGNELGAYQATHFLIKKGHRHIALVGSTPQAYPSIQERRAGYVRAMQEAGLTPCFADCRHHPDEAGVRAAEFLPKHPEITAVLGANDEVAISVMRVAQQLGKSVPQDLSVMGFDNISLAQHISPALTTMRIDKTGMGRLAAQLLLNRIEYPQMGQVQMVMRPSLIERQSVRFLG